MRLLAMSVAVLALGCGAKSGLEVPELESEPVDASARPDTNTCAEVTLSVRPTVVLVVDQSGSMEFEAPGGGRRWDVLRAALVGPDGLVTELSDRVDFGLSLYSARSEFEDMGGPAVGECPLLTNVAPAERNLATIREVLESAEPIEDTPTGDALDAIRETLMIDPIGGPTVFVVATDGDPDRCEELDPQNGQGEAVDAARRAFDEGIRTFIVDVGGESVSRSHLQDMANAGVGRSDATFWAAADVDGLTRALREIVTREIACELVLAQAIVVDRACGATIRLNGRPLLCGGDDGWRARDAVHIELLGSACDEVQRDADATLEGSFPCDVLAD